MSMKDVFEKIEDGIKKQGWGVMSVAPDPANSIESFQYTVGLERNFKHPEILTFSLPLETGHHLLNSIGDRVKNGETFEPFQKVPGVLAHDMEVVFRPLKLDYYKDYMNMAVHWYTGNNFRTHVMLWPDEHNVLPTEREYSYPAQKDALKITSDKIVSRPPSTPPTIH